MPCRDDGDQRGCSSIHLEDATIAQLELQLQVKKKEAIGAARAKKAKESEAKRRARLTEEFVAQALTAMKDNRFAVSALITVIFAEHKKVESYMWRWDAVTFELRKWLKACRKFPDTMKFKIKIEEDRPVLWSWHTHEEKSA